ncbi:MAG: YceD family protein [Bacteroidota bacterium]|nr:YceD family protein [Bacteroidota bacterium]
MLTFDLAECDRAQFMCEAEDLDLDPAVFSAVGVRVEHVRHADRRRLRVAAEADVRLTCDRTLRAFSRKIVGNHEIALLKPGELNEDLPDMSHLVLQPWQTRIDLTAAVRDTLLLAVPVRKVAPNAEDVEIPMIFGAPDEPEGWEALKQFQSAAHLY